MKLTFLGGCEEVGKSCFWVGENGNSILLDAGIKTQDHEMFPKAPPSSPDAIVISHAHLDHVGALPTYFKNAAPKVFCTPPTKALAELLLSDALRVCEKNKKPPLYSRFQLSKALSAMELKAYNTEWKFKNFILEFMDAGHILGSAQTIVKADKTLVYSGDLKLEKTRMHNPAKIYKGKVDALIVESTYALKDHLPRAQIEKKFVEAVKEALDANKCVIIPCFAVGRTQEIIQVLVENKISAPIYLEGMGVSASDIAVDFPSYSRDYESLLSALKQTNIIQTRKTSKICKPGNIIVATAGMLSGGPVLRYILYAQKNLNAEIFLTGYQVEGTNGRNLLDKKVITVGDKTVKIDLPVYYFDFSAHAGKKDLFEYVKQLSPQKVFCVHGEKEATETFAEELRNIGFDALAPKIGESCELK